MDLKRIHGCVLSFYRQETWGPGVWNPPVGSWQSWDWKPGRLRNFTLKEITWLGQGHTLSKVGTDGISAKVCLTPKATRFLCLQAAALKFLGILITKVAYVYVKLWENKKILNES